MKASSVQKLTELGPYMDVSVQPVGKVSQLTEQQHNGAAVSQCLFCAFVSAQPPRGVVWGAGGGPGPEQAGEREQSWQLVLLGFILRLVCQLRPGGGLKKWERGIIMGTSQL